MPQLFSQEHAEKFISIILDSNHCCEIRGIKATIMNSGLIVSPQKYHRTVGGFFNDPPKMIAELKHFQGVSAYITVNPVNRRLLGRTNNRMMILESGGATKDEDIECLRWLYIDIDCKRPSGVSSTNEELASCIELRNKVLAEESKIRENSVWGCSGNGAWILVRLEDWPNNDESKNRQVKWLSHLAQKYGIDGQSDTFIDQRTKNASRVMCFPGTLKCKGDNVIETPWRLVTIDGGYCF